MRKTLLVCLFLGFCLQESLKTKVESVLQNKDLLKLIKAFKLTRTEESNDSESLLQATLSKFGKVLGDEHIEKVDLSEERRENRAKVQEIERLATEPNQEVLVAQMEQLIDPVSEEYDEKKIREAKHMEEEKGKEQTEEDQNAHPLIHSHVKENQNEEFRSDSADQDDSQSAEAKREDELLMPQNDHLSEKMKLELKQNEEDLSILGIKKSNFNIDGILDHLTKKMIQHGPGIHKHLGRIKKHIGALQKANLIDSDHLEAIKNHVDVLHDHVGIIAANQNADHLSGLREAARNAIKNAAGLGTAENDAQENEAHSDSELDLSKLAEMEEAQKLLGEMGHKSISQNAKSELESSEDKDQT